MVFAFNLNDVPDGDDAETGHQEREQLDDESMRKLPFELGKKPSQTQKSTERSKKRKGDGDDKPAAKKKTKRSHTDQKAALTTAKPIKSSIICGVDFGTTHSGVSYRSNISSADLRIHTITKWPDSNRSGQNLSKVPSRIAYKDENKASRRGEKTLACDKIGWQVRPGMKSYTWFKLLLDERADPTEYDCPLLHSAVGEGTLKLPPGKSVIDVVADYLRILKKDLMHILAGPIGEDILKITPINFWFTVPAIWDDRAQARTKTALELAGYDRRSIDKVYFVTEPEAAAACVLKQAIDQDSELLKKDMCVVVVDIGGGTIDAESMIVHSLSPLRLKTVGIGEGCKSGSTAIDRRFIAYMHETFGESFATLEDEKRGPGSKFMYAFESEKRSFRGDNDEEHRISFPALASKLSSQGPLARTLPIQDGEVVLQRTDMVNFFSLTLNQACSLIQRQVNKVKKAKKAIPEALILAGGLADSEYMLQQIREFCEDTYGAQLKVLRPDNAWGAISHGAVEYGLDRTIVISRSARRWYCMVAQRAFEEGVHPEHRAVICPVLGKRVKGSLTTLLAKGAEVKESRHNYTRGKIVIDDTTPQALRYSWDIICSNADNEPQWEDDPGCYVIGQLDIDLTPLPMQWANDGHYNHDAAKEPVPVTCNIVTTGGHGAGIMHIAVNANRKKVGEMTLNCSA